MITPHAYVSNVMELLFKHEGTVVDMEDWGFERVKMILEMPLRELMRNFFDEMKSVTSGYASVAYEGNELRPANVTRMDVYVAEDRIAAFSKVIPEYRAQEEAEEVVEKLEKILNKL